MTFSIVAWSPGGGSGPEWGIAVASKFLAVGALVPWAKAPIGAVATQALANLSYGPDGLSLLATGRSADEVVEELTAADPERDHRQLGVVDSQGRAATYTGSACLEWAGGVTDESFCCQGNILTGPDVVDAMAEAFGAARGDLSERLIAALSAGDSAGGDRRGRQSAAVYVVREGAGYGGTIDRAVDLRVDDHPDPVGEVRRLFAMQRLYFPRPEDLDFVEVDAALAAEIRRVLAAWGYEIASDGGYDDALRKTLYDWIGTENLEERWSDEARIERAVLDHLRRGRA